MAFTTSNTEAMRIVSSGYVGIGTAAPTSMLHVNGSMTPNSNVFTGSAVYAAAGLVMNGMGVIADGQSRRQRHIEALAVLVIPRRSDFGPVGGLAGLVDHESLVRRY